ncbi:ABC transporter substrate-binding protein [Paracoccus sp. (in: a-proteobacteria)]|uniref:ABC transporter substrate-binding protein n=1 Tax=Paracoccus sp. TaxID=267 RepID=UPI0026DF91EB|nr:ABC transporter substrate-binding protein [Paracoccus sp. (in: a-proteobacteria)]MDO5648490.1 ABC transporter substrate-binding protein [Paracoccus sp. (in: a-proteobacteria)]
MKNVYYGISRRALLATGLVAGMAFALPTTGAFAQEVNPDATIQAAIAYGLSGTFDPLNASGAVTLGANWHTFEGLVDLDPVTRQPYAALAAAMPATDDGTTYTIKLRDGAVFHNGDAVTADDVVFSFNRVLDPESKSLFRSFVAFIDSVEAVDDTTVKITTKYPFSLFNERLGSVKIVPKALIESDAEGFGKSPVGTGPYKMISAVPEDKIIFERFDAYTGPRPAKAAEMVWNLISDPTARVNALTSGTVMAIEDVPYVDADMVAASETLEKAQSFGLLFAMFNTQAEPFDDVRVRQAFFYALDMDKIIGTGMLDNATAASSFLPETHPNYHQASTVYTYDPDKARALLADAGEANPAITLMSTDHGWVRDVAPIIQESLNAVGFQTTLDIGQSGGQYGKVDAGDMQVMIAPGDPSVFGNDPDILMQWWYGDNIWPTTRYRWADSEGYKTLTATLAEAQQLDGDAQQAKWNEAFDLLSNEVPLYPLFHRMLPTAWNDGELVGFAPVPTTGLSFLDVGVAK